MNCSIKIDTVKSVSFIVYIEGLQVIIPKIFYFFLYVANSADNARIQKVFSEGVQL